MVASFTDAWIETHKNILCRNNSESHLLQMRGLKPVLQVSKHAGGESHLLQMRGLKQCGKRFSLRIVVSHLLQMRGLKHKASKEIINTCLSHLLQMRGLKLKDAIGCESENQVASFTDAWIETSPVKVL